MEAGPPQEDPNQGPEEDPTSESSTQPVCPPPVCPICGEPVGTMAAISIQIVWNEAGGGWEVDAGYLSDLSSMDVHREAMSTLDDLVYCENGHETSRVEALETALAKVGRTA